MVRLISGNWGNNVDFEFSALIPVGWEIFAAGYFVWTAPCRSAPTEGSPSVIESNEMKNSKSNHCSANIR